MAELLLDTQINPWRHSASRQFEITVAPLKMHTHTVGEQELRHNVLGKVFKSRGVPSMRSTWAVGECDLVDDDGECSSSEESV